MITPECLLYSYVVTDYPFSEYKPDRYRMFSRLSELAKKYKSKNIKFKRNRIYHCRSTSWHEQCWDDVKQNHQSNILSCSTRRGADEFSCSFINTNVFEVKLPNTLSWYLHVPSLFYQIDWEQYRKEISVRHFGLKDELILGSLIDRYIRQRLKLENEYIVPFDEIRLEYMGTQI